MILTSSVRSVSGHDTVGIPDDSARALDCAHAAANADRRVDHRFSFLNSDRACRAFPLAYTAGDARIIACLARGLPKVAVTAFRLYIIVRQDDLNEVLRTDANTESASDAFSFVDCRRASVHDLDGRKVTGSFARAAAEASVSALADTVRI